MHTEVGKPNKTILPTDYDPEKGLKTIRVSEAAEKLFARAKDTEALYKAVEAKIDAQAEYIVWRDNQVTPSRETGSSGVKGRFTRQDGSALPKADPGKVIAHHWREKFTMNTSKNGKRLTVKDPNKIRVAKEDAKEKCVNACEGTVTVKKHPRAEPVKKHDLAESEESETVTVRSVRVLAFDLMTTIGYAYRTKAGPVAYGTFDFKSKSALKSVEQDVTIIEGKKKKKRKNEARGMRWKRFRDYLDAMIKEFDPTAIYFEEVKGFNPIARGRDARIYWCFEAVLTGWCEEHRLPYYPIPVGTIKKAETGRGDATKEMMMKSVRMRGYEPQDHNAADALALLNYAEKAQEEASS